MLTLRLILFAAFISLPLLSYSQDSITVEDIWGRYAYLAKRVPGFNFMNDGKHYSRLEKNVIKKYDLTSGKYVSDLVDGSKLKGAADFDGEIDSYHFNHDESVIIIESKSEPIYRRSSKAYYYIYDRDKKTLDAVFADDKIMYATLSPDGTKVAYVWQNNIYYLNLSDRSTVQITDDGKTNALINGSADWVYEEEFAFAQAFHWSPDSKKIAFLKFDESEVPEFTMTNFNNDLYPEYVTFKYPKVGEKNAVVTAHTYLLQTKQTVDIKLDNSEEYYIPRIMWTNNPDLVMLYKMNRHQNKLELLLTNVYTGSTKTVMKEENKYFIEITDDIRFLDNDEEFIWSSEKSGYNHLYLMDFDGNEKAKLTTGNYDVINFYGVDEEDGKIYYRAAEKNSREKHIYTADLAGENKKLLTDLHGTNSAQFSSTFDYFVNTNSSINTPPTYVVHDNTGQTVRVIEDNAKLNKRHQNMKLNPVEFFDFETKDQVTLNGWMIKPADFDPTKKYPVFMYLYGGPGSQQVTDGWKSFNYWWFQLLSQNGYLVACVDNRGTGARGEEFRKMTYMNLGHYETIDQIEAAKYLGSLSYTDADRIGIFGWSYGGYMSSLCLLKGNDVFKAAIAVAPVTNWRWYDTIYTERYMRTEKENPDGYADNSPINFADRLKGNYLLVHGMGDDNVHWQNTVEMANALIAANKQFDTYFYPNRTHGISGGNTRLHLYNKMTEFLFEKL